MKTVLIYSGGLDSTVLLYSLHRAGHELLTLSVNYGQRHSKELDAAAAITTQLGIEHRVVDLTTLTPLLANSSLTDVDIAVPEGHYAEETMKATVVPNRNMILLSVAAGWAISMKADSIAYAAHSGDHAIYPDCRNEFAEAMDHAIRLADWHEVHLDRPFVNKTKADIVKLGAELDVPFEQTWSCYQGGAIHCGRCGTCIERREAFYLAGVPDPTPYADNAPSVETMVSNDWRL
ncbi:7-cyano-7-deazaguanine synthase QueC [Rubellicoccus peritrichatus]|uniref:7-cyano-7-deazaguanine synthase n=1 Tax=Rubellicoccus peritrichatus TaxID=3080537 RepID=A0AAQ3LDR5_9BACT|nr:7-cyano-7-deazaguanine synthase QueC [Puniceicoccus sp. CR14]WOO42564.1 7-cyano-7-deazaguanine synthase QueC [Puniceicoccus sp. CR14]